MNEKQRAEFDVFWQEKILDAGWTLNKTESYFVWKRAWQAAIASVVVDIPSFFSDRYETDIIYSDDMEKALDKAGIRYE